MVALVLFLGAAPTMAQSGGWTHWGGNPESQRYAPHDQITAENFEDLEVAWIWRGDNFGPSVDNILRSTPIYAEGKLFGVAGQRRTVIAMDPATGETLWTFREPPPAVGRLDAEELRQRGGLRAGQWPRTDLRGDSRVLSPRP